MLIKQWLVSCSAACVSTACERIAGDWDEKRIELLMPSNGMVYLACKWVRNKLLIEPLGVIEFPSKWSREEEGADVLLVIQCATMSNIKSLTESRSEKRWRVEMWIYFLS